VTNDLAVRAGEGSMGRRREEQRREQKSEDGP
jgi:hypothetical protein